MQSKDDLYALPNSQFDEYVPYAASDKYQSVLDFELQGERTVRKNLLDLLKRTRKGSRVSTDYGTLRRTTHRPFRSLHNRWTALVIDEIEGNVAEDILVREWALSGLQRP